MLRWPSWFSQFCSLTSRHALRDDGEQSHETRTRTQPALFVLAFGEPPARVLVGGPGRGARRARLPPRPARHLVTARDLPRHRLRRRRGVWRGGERARRAYPDRVHRQHAADGRTLHRHRRVSDGFFTSLGAERLALRRSRTTRCPAASAAARTPSVSSRPPERPALPSTGSLSLGIEFPAANSSRAPSKLSSAACGSVSAGRWMASLPVAPSGTGRAPGMAS